MVHAEEESKFDDDDPKHNEERGDTELYSVAGVYCLQEYGD